MIRKFVFLILAIISYSCKSPEGPPEAESYIPELIFINKDLTFTMGRLDLPNWTWTNLIEVPPFKVILSPFYIGKYEVRNDEYVHFVNDSGYCDSTLWSEAGWEFIKGEDRIRPVGWITGDGPWIKRPLSNTPAKSKPFLPQGMRDVMPSLTMSSSSMKISLYNVTPPVVTVYRSPLMYGSPNVAGAFIRR